MRRIFCVTLMLVFLWWVVPTYASDPLLPPQNLHNGSIITGTFDIGLMWDDTNIDETQYRIEYIRADFNVWREIVRLPANTNFYSTYIESCDTLYEFRVRAYRSSDNSYSEYSNLVSYSIPCTYVVNTVLDTNDGICDTTNCSLREAVNAANTITNAIISLPSDTYDLNAPLNINAPMSITGDASNISILDAQGQTHFFNVDFCCSTGNSNYFLVQGLRFHNGNATPFGASAAIFNHLSNDFNVIKLRTATIRFASGGNAVIIEPNDYILFYLNDMYIDYSSAAHGLIYVSRSGTTTYPDVHWISIDRTSAYRNTASTGASILQMDGNNNRAEIARSTFGYNGYDTAPGTLFVSNGSNTVVTFQNSVFSDNGGSPSIFDAVGSASQYGFYNVTMVNDHADANHAVEINGGGSGATVTIENSIMESRNGTTFCDVSGTITWLGSNNLLNNFGCPASGTSGVDVKLQPFANNHTSVMSHRLTIGSPAIDAGTCIYTSDHRNYPRPDGAGCDIGAYEGYVEAPQNLVVTGTTSTAVSLDWDALVNTSSYQIELYDTINQRWISTGASGSNTTAYTDTALFCETTYQFRVSSYYGSLGYSGYSLPVEATTGACSQPPTAQFTYNCLGLACSFNGTSSTDSNGTIINYAWDFGDGATASPKANVGHIFPAVGTYSVTLTVQDDWGITHPTSQNITVTTTDETAYIVNSTADTYDGICNLANCTIRDAIDAAQWVPDGVVYIPSGNYNIASSLVIKGGLSIRGESRTNTIITGNTSFDMFTTSVSGDPVPLTLSDLSLDTGRRAIRDTNDLNSLTLLRTNFSHFDDSVAIYEMSTVDYFVLLIEKSSFLENVSHFGLFEMGGASDNSALVIRDSYIAYNNGVSATSTAVLTITTPEFQLLIENTMFAHNMQLEGRTMIETTASAPQLFEINNSTFLDNGNTIYSTSYLFDVYGSNLIMDWRNLTFVGNVAPSRLRPTNPMTFNLYGTIIASDGVDPFTDCRSQYIDVISDYNLTDYYTDCFPISGEIVFPGGFGFDQLLTDETDYFTEYITLTMDSPALDAMPPEWCRGDVDQRGVSRPQGLGCDIGAVEMESISMPIELVETGTTDTSVSLAWTDTPEATSYRIERSDDGNNWFEVGTTAVNTTTFTDNTVTCSTTYQYRIQATDGTLLSAYSEILWANTPPCLQTGPVFTVSGNGGSPWAECRVNYCTLNAALEVANADEGESILLPAGDYGAGYYLTHSIHIVGAGAGQTIFNGNGSSILFTVADGVPEGISLTLDGVTLQGGYADSGTAVFPDPEGVFGSITVRNSHILDNVGDATIFYSPSGDEIALTFENVNISNNVSERDGLILLSGATALPRQLVIRDSVISENTTTGSFGVGFAKILTNGYELVIEASAFVGNSGDTSGSLFEISGASNTPIQISNSTFSANTSYPTRASVADISGVVNLVMSHNTITQNTGTPFDYNPGSMNTMTLFGNISAGNEGEDFGCRNVVSLGYNIFGNMDCISASHITDIPTNEPLLSGQMEYNGTLVYGPQSGSPALNAIPAGNCTLTTDQVGSSRPQGSGCDIGAFEVDGDFLPAPTNLTVTNTTLTSITLSWTDTVNETGYRVERSLNGTDWLEVGTTAANVNTFTNSNLTCGTTYHYRVRAADGAVFWEYSEPISATIAPCVLTLPAPTSLNTVGFSYYDVSLSWLDNASDETNYRVERSLDGNNWTEITTLAANVVAHSDTGLTCDTTYWYRVRAYRAADTLYSAYSNSVSATTAPCAPVLSLGTVGQTSVQLTWADVLTETQYRLERSPDGTNNWTEITQPVQNATSYTDNSVVCEGHYVYRIRAYRSSDNLYSQYSTSISADTLLCALTAPTGLSVTASIDTAIMLQWSESNNSDTAHLLEQRDDGINWVQIAELAPTSTAYTNTGLTCETSYEYRVRVYRSTDNAYSGFSNIINPMTALCPVPKTPTDLQTTAINPRSVDLAWLDHNFGVMRYTVERSDNGGTSWQSYPVLANDVTTFNAYNLLCQHDYQFRVRGLRVVDSLLTDYSTTINVQTAACPALVTPNAPTLTSFDRTFVALSFTVDSSGEVDNWQLERLTVGNWQLVATLPVNTTQYTDNNLTCATSYSYRLRSYRAEDSALSAYSTETPVTTASCPAIIQSTVGLYKNGRWLFTAVNATGVPDVMFNFGPTAAGWTPLVGDWDGDGVDGIGVYRNGLFILRNSSSAGTTDAAFYFGAREADWQPIVGDWNGDGVDTVGVYKAGLLRLTNNHATLTTNYSFRLGDGTAGWIALAGDWDNNGADSIGLYRNGAFYLTNSLNGTGLRRPFRFGPASSDWTPLTGDWDADGTDTIGVYRQSVWRLRDSNSTGGVDTGFNFGAREAGWIPLASYRGGFIPLAALASAPNVTVEPIGEVTIIPTESVSTPEITVEATPIEVILTPAVVTPESTVVPTLEPTPEITVEATPIIELTAELSLTVEPTISVPVEMTPEGTESVSQP